MSLAAASLVSAWQSSLALPVSSAVLPANAAPSHAVEPGGRGEFHCLPISLLRPFWPLFEEVALSRPDHFLAGLKAESLLGARVLPAGAHRREPVAWVGVALHAPMKRVFDSVRGGCWVPGFPCVGRGRELLRRAGVCGVGEWLETLRELGLPPSDGAALYFNFPAATAVANCARIYLLDASGRGLHGFALPLSALAAAPVK